MTTTDVPSMSSPPAPALTHEKLLGQHVARVVGGLQARYTGSGDHRRDPAAAAALARLRRADAADLTRALDVLDLVLDEFPPPLLGHADLPTRAERSAHTAICLYAVHQQSQSQPMHMPARSLGAAARILSAARSKDGSIDQATLRRFHAVATATGPGQRAHHLRNFVSLLRGEQVPLDYGRLARDLYLLDGDPSSVSRVRLRWGRDLHRHTHQTVPNSDPQPATA